MSNKTRLTKDGRKMQKFLKKYGYDVGRKHAGHLIYEKDGVPYKAILQLRCVYGITKK